MKMIVEQTQKYHNRMVYDPQSKTFSEGNSASLAYLRGFNYPYGWIKESGTPPLPHWDVCLMTEQAFELGDEVEIKVIGVFYRHDGDHKFIAVLKDRAVNDFSELSKKEIDALHNLYPRIDLGEGWLGREKALKIMKTEEKAM